MRSSLIRAILRCPVISRRRGDGLLEEPLENQVVPILRGRYADFGRTLAIEQLAELTPRCVQISLIAGLRNPAEWLLDSTRLEYNIAHGLTHSLESRPRHERS